MGLILNRGLCPSLDHHDDEAGSTTIIDGRVAPRDAAWPLWHLATLRGLLGRALGRSARGSCPRSGYDTPLALVRSAKEAKPRGPGPSLSGPPRSSKSGHSGGQGPHVPADDGASALARAVRRAASCESAQRARGLRTEHLSSGPDAAELQTQTARPPAISGKGGRVPSG